MAAGPRRLTRPPLPAPWAERPIRRVSPVTSPRKRAPGTIRCARRPQFPDDRYRLSDYRPSASEWLPIPLSHVSSQMCRKKVGRQMFKQVGWGWQASDRPVVSARPAR
ncbi:hypothetical protein GCM10010429_10790 [Micromonospora olivasterospora]